MVRRTDQRGSGCLLDHGARKRRVRGDLGAGDQRFDRWTPAARYDTDGNLELTTVLSSEAGESVDVYAIESTPAGVWLAGAVQQDAWVGIYDPAAGTIRDALIEDHLGYRDVTHAIARSQDEVAIAATVSTSPNFDGDAMLLASTDVLVVHFDLQGNELRRTLVGPSPDPEYVRTGTRIVADEAGKWFVGGNTTPHDATANYTGWLVPVEAPLAWDWTTNEDQLEFLADLSGDDTGVLIAGNRIAPDDSGVLVGQGWLTSLASDAASRWIFDRNDDAVENYLYCSHEVLVRDLGGRLRTAGVYAEPGSATPPVVRSCLITE